jgi:putative pyrroloquinoline-quinone binding quinoprotein
MNRTVVGIGTLAALVHFALLTVRGDAQQLPSVEPVTTGQVELDDDPFGDHISVRRSSRSQVAEKTRKVPAAAISFVPIRKRRPTDVSKAGCILSNITQQPWEADFEFRIIFRSGPPQEYVIQFYREEGVFLTLPAHECTRFSADSQMVVYPDYAPDRPGCSIVAYDAASGKELWRTTLSGGDASWHDTYVNRIEVALSEQSVWIRGWESSMEYVATLDRKTGHVLSSQIVWQDRPGGRRVPVIPSLAPRPQCYSFDDEQLIVFDEGRSFLFPSLTQVEGDCEIHLPSRLVEIEFVRDGKSALTEPADIHAVFCVRAGTLYWVDYRAWQGCGCRVRAMDLSTGQQLWATEARATGAWSVARGGNRINMDVDEKYVTILGLENHGGYRGYREVFDRKSGERIFHRVYPAPKPIVARPDLQILDGVTSREEALEAVEWLGGQVPHGDRSGNSGDGIVSIQWPQKEFRDEWLSLLEYFPELQRISLGGEQLTDAGLVYLKNLRRLEVLSIWGPKVTDEGLEHLSEFDSLRELHLGSRCISDAGLEHITSLNALEKLAISSEDVKGPGLAHLGDLENLAVLNLTGLQLARDGLSHLSRAPRLKELLLGATPISGRSLVHLRNMPTIEVLDLTRTSITDDDLRMIAPLIQLTELRVLRTNLTGEGLRHLADLDNLEVLDLSYTQMTDDATTHLRQMKELRKLVLCNTPLSSGSLAHLKQLRACQTLILLGTQISDVGLEQLADMPALEWVNLSRTQVTEEGIRRLKELRPYLIIR